MTRKRPGRKFPEYVFGNNWPTLDIELLEDEELESKPSLLLDWHSPYFRLAKFVRAARQAVSDGNVPIAEYLGSLHTQPTQYDITHQFLSLVQSLESAHTSRHGMHRPGFDETAHASSVARLMTDLKAREVNSRKRSKIEYALLQATPRYSLAERIDETVADLSIQHPEDPPSWLDSPPTRVRRLDWSNWIADARNDLAHGNTHHDPHWLGQQNKFLKRVVEFEILRSLGLGIREARGAMGV